MVFGLGDFLGGQITCIVDVSRVSDEKRQKNQRETFFRITWCAYLKTLLCFRPLISKGSTELVCTYPWFMVALQGAFSEMSA